MTTPEEFDAWWEHAGTEIRERLLAVQGIGRETKLAVVLHSPDDLEPLWFHMRDFDGRDALEDLYRAAAAEVTIWDVDPDHLVFPPIDVSPDGG